MKISRYRSGMIMTIAVITIAIGLVAGVLVGLVAGVKVSITTAEVFNWICALIVFIPLLATGLLLFGLAQFASLCEEIEAKISENQEYDE